ncbi:Do family serine endopeptidase [Ereboglobus luteus]|uniref:Protease Do n=1 Tax=Ereboglobus luteus TaxID=1796921 RepID=A0A2U8E0Z2_9BACT|nr:Do family serine endopeptidase [Ereboglobus luteus]AWI08445.1 protease Do [Ereboglobus luteus]
MKHAISTLALAFVFAASLFAAPPANPLPQLKIDDAAVGDGKSPALASYADAVEPAKKSVVSIASARFVRQRLPFPWFAPGANREYKVEGLGSGVIVSADGYILTNNHVVEDADELTVILSDDREFKARVIGTDPKTDVAVIKIDAKNLPLATLADSDKLRVGDIVFAIGNPLGIGQTVTMGIVSATGRRVGILAEVEGYEDFIQTDASINQGNSGGALIDAKGRLVGINSAIISPTRGNVGIGFAIPANLARNIMNNLVTSGKVTRGYFGASGEPLTPDLAEALDLPRDTRGVILNDVTPDGPADNAGLRRYDVITAINNRPVTNAADLRTHVAQLPPDTEVTVRIFRDGKAETAIVRLGKSGDALAYNELLPGVQVTRLTASQRRSLRISSSVDGLYVVKVDGDSPYKDWFAEGAVILEINRARASSVETARNSLVRGRNLFVVYSKGAVRTMVLVVK